MNWYVINIDWLRAAEFASSAVEIREGERADEDERGGRFPTVRQDFTGSGRRMSAGSRGKSWAYARARGRTTCPAETEVRGRDATDEAGTLMNTLSRDAHCERATRNAIRSSQLVFRWRLFWSFVSISAPISMNHIATLFHSQRVKYDRFNTGGDPDVIVNSIFNRNYHALAVISDNEI